MADDWDVYEYTNKLNRVIVVWVGFDATSKPGIYKKFARYIGDPHDGKRRYSVDITKPEIRALIDKLDGPHCATLLKVMEIQRGKEKA